MRGNGGGLARRKSAPALLAPRKYHEVLRRVYGDSRYAGKHLLIAGDRIYSARTGRQASRLLERIMRAKPKEMPLRVDVPAADTLILWLRG
jgi:hypothetical protein